MANYHLGRRFLKTRTRSWALSIAAKVSNYSISPNQISILSVISAILAAFSLLQITSPWKWLLAILFIQFRLFCNMLDGLVAIEGGKSSKLGDIYNDLPDRISDVLIIVAFGYSVPSIIIYQLGNIVITNSVMAWIAAIMAVFTAYVRILFFSLGAPANYCGPMAKQHRMALLTIASLIQVFMLSNNVVTVTLLILNFGLIITIHRRISTGAQYILCH